MKEEYYDEAGDTNRERESVVGGRESSYVSRFPVPNSRLK